MALLTGLLGAAMVLTLGTRIGVPMWHYHVSLLGVFVAAAVGWPFLKRRRVATIAMLYTGVPAVATGFVMLYTREFGYKEWITWWHCVTSFALMVAFLAHWLHNHPRLWGFTRRLFTKRRIPGLVLGATWAGVFLAALLTWGSEASDAIHRENYRFLASWAILVGVGGSYGAWLLYRFPAMRARLARAEHRNRARALIDTSLFLAHWGAIVTGFVLLYAPLWLEMNGIRYVGKWWHTATSVAFLALVTLHVGFNARLLAAHARRMDQDLALAATKP
jgi:hypothetical protein